MRHKYTSLIAAATIVAVAVVSCRKAPAPSTPFDSLYPADSFTMSPDSIVKELFNRPYVSCISSRYDYLTPYDVWLTDAVIAPDTAAIILADRLDWLNRLPDFDVRGMRWPLVASDAVWVSAAAEVALMWPDNAFISKASKAARNLVDGDDKLVRNASTGLYRGASPSSIDQRFPNLPDAALIASEYSLENNIHHLVALRFLAEIDDDVYLGRADTLSTAMSTLFWMPTRGFFSSTLYGADPYNIRADEADNLAQYFGVAAGAFPQVQAATLVRRTPVSHAEVSPRFPTLPSGSRRKLLTAAYRAVAAAYVGNIDAFSHAFAQLATHALTDDYARRLLRGTVVRGLIGVRPMPDGLHFSPLVPPAFTGNLSLEGLHYGDAEIDVTIIGTGNIVSTFAIDGEISDDFVLPAGSSGKHLVTITLAGVDDSLSGMTVADISAPPAIPGVSLTDDGYSIEASENVSTTLNGALYMTSTPSILSTTEFTSTATLDFAEVNSDGIVGRSARHYHIPASDSIIILADDVAAPSLYAFDRRVKRKHVVSTRYRNWSIGFDVEVEHPGFYYVFVDYLDGLGIVNPDLRYAMRMLRHDGTDAALMVFGQLDGSNWSPNRAWYDSHSLSQPAIVNLHEGVNHLSLDYFYDRSRRFDHDANTLLPLRFIVVPTN